MLSWIKAALRFPDLDIYTDSVKALNYSCANPQRIDAVIVDQTMPTNCCRHAGAVSRVAPLCSGYSDAIDENTQLFGFNKPVNATELLIALDEEITHPV